MLTSHRQKYNPKKPNANVKPLFFSVQEISVFFSEKILTHAGGIKKIPLRAFTEKDIIKTRFIYFYRNA